MEKIYEQNGKKKQSFFQQIFNDKGSMVAVVVVAIVAVVGLVAFGFNQISYAADETGGQGVPGPVADFVSAEGAQSIIGTGGAYPDTVSMSVRTFMKDSGEYVICTDYLANFIAGNNYYYQKSISDAGLRYLITELDKKLANVHKDAAYWLKQSAVWAYLLRDDTASLDQSYASASQETKDKIDLYRQFTKENLKKVSELYYDSASGTEVIDESPSASYWADYGIESVYDTAVGMSGQKYTGAQYAIAIAGLDGKFSVTEDGKYYVSSSFAVTASNSNALKMYSLYLDGAPEGSMIYYADGDPCELTEGGSCNVYDVSQKFKLMIPVNKVTEQNKKFKIQAYAIFEATDLFYYGADGYQTVITTGTIDEYDDVEQLVDVNYTPDVPDTGMTTAQTIYFIGLIILLSGVGIIYATAKPQEQN